MALNPSTLKPSILKPSALKYRKSLFCKSIVALALASLMPAAAHAHRPWLLPSSSNVDGKDPWVTIDTGISENLFDVDNTGMKLDGLVITGPDGATLQPDATFVGHQRTSIDLKLAKPGTYKISIAGESVMASYKLNGEPKRFRGTTEAFAKEVPADAQELQKSITFSRNETFVTTGEPNTTVLKPSNIGLEMIPITHPTQLFAGEKASFRFLIDGKPAAKLGLSLIPGGVRYRGVLNEIRLVTHDKGEASLIWPAAGMYWMTAAWPERTPGMEGQGPGQGPGEGKGQAQPARRLAYSATLEVLPQ
ncbi:MAG TPA: DUF4198 domain-containing protein [Spongiibacteraceae bacterium]|nr:DUF4198 domain-containing protein [Spongiibacteraceae bacterium]